jgi:hypothetical protein
MVPGNYSTTIGKGIAKNELHPFQIICLQVPVFSVILAIDKLNISSNVEEEE